MVKIDIISGFQGSGKTTLIKNITEQWDTHGDPLVIIENDFGNVKLDVSDLSLSNIHVAELNTGCVCCSLADRLFECLSDILNTIRPSRIILEPSGAARLSDILITIGKLGPDLRIEPGSIITMAAPFRSPAHRTRFFGIYKNQLLNARLILPCHLGLIPPEKRRIFLQALKEDAEGVPVLNVPWQETDIKTLWRLSSRSGAALESNGRFITASPLKMRAVSRTLKTGT